MIKDDKLVDTDFNLYIGKRLKKYRLEHNLSLLALAKKLNNKISRQTLFHYENGDTKIRRNIFIDICNVYNITPDDFINEVLKDYINSKGGDKK